MRSTKFAIFIIHISSWCIHILKKIWNTLWIYLNAEVIKCNYLRFSISQSSATIERNIALQFTWCSVGRSLNPFSILNSCKSEAIGFSKPHIMYRDLTFKSLSLTLLNTYNRYCLDRSKVLGKNNVIWNSLPAILLQYIFNTILLTLSTEHRYWT